MTSTPIELRTRPVGEAQMNTYVLVCPQTRQSVLIDPGAEPEALLELLAGTTPVAILLTHTHRDHVGALDEMHAQLNVPLLAHPGPHTPGFEVSASRWITDGDTIQVGDYTLTAIHTPGHSLDMLSFAVQGDNKILVGDTLFEGGPGRTWAAEEFLVTLETLRNIVLHWDDNTICYPGHGPAFRLGDRRADIEAFVNKDHGNFYGNATWDM